MYLIKSILAMPVEERGIHNSLYRITENTCLAFSARISFYRSIGIDILTFFLKVFLVHLNRNLHAVRIN